MDNKKKDIDVLDAAKAREIVQTILDFGVTDYQIQKIIKFLALELINRDMMLEIIDAIDNPKKSTKIEL